MCVWEEEVKLFEAVMVFEIRLFLFFNFFCLLGGLEGFMKEGERKKHDYIVLDPR